MKDLVDFEQQSDKVLFSKIEDREIQVEYHNGKQYDSNVSWPIEIRPVVDARSSRAMVDSDDCRRVYIE